jgi:uncharacterized membrane protein
MESISTYKNRAIASLENKWIDAAIVALVYFVIYEGINFAVSSFMTQETGFIFQLVWLLACAPLTWGFGVMFLDFIRGGELKVGKLFDGYKDCLRLSLAFFLYLLVVLVGVIFFIVPGIIFAMMFAQVPYILRDDENIGVIDALKKSANMMKGHKMQLFLLYLSFIGWAILAILTLGIGYLFLFPYMYTTVAHYYEDLKLEASYQ